MAEVEEADAPIPRIRTEPPRLSPDRDEVAQRASKSYAGAARPMLMAGTSVKWSHASESMNPLHREKRTSRPSPTGWGAARCPMTRQSSSTDRDAMP